MMQPSPEPKRLVRIPEEAWVGGVAAGLAEYFGMDVTPLRVALALLIVFTGVAPGLLAYLVMWLIIPKRGARPPTGVPPQP